ncbi:hypothetical protein OS493_013072 [Desmophyllum pertusum]|uniref:CCHC-type domain-containing protein n=1 Tax=Desmophyllum pertusum TaxID=174260 RepID=A0A9X0CLC8_9CNID|nr:hypothetical protein OS493_013072 [Desmophyllum pertusum]
MAEDAKNQRRAAKSRFTRKLTELMKSIDDDKGVEIVKRNYDELTEAWRNAAKHSEAMEQYIRYAAAKVTKEMTVKQEVELAKKDFDKTQRMINQAFIKRSTAEAVFKTLVDETVHLLDMCDGDKDSIPAIRKVQQALETSLADCKAANDKYFEFLNREEALLEVGWILFVQKRYNQVTDKIESHVAKVSPESRRQSIDEARQKEEDKRFIEFVKIVDSGYQDLMRISLEKEITTTSSIIEKRLPPDVRKDWAKLVSSNTSSVDKKDKFPSLLKFLLNQKRAIEYDSADLRKSVQQSVNHINTEVEEVDENDQLSRQRVAGVFFTITLNTKTGECRLYLPKTWEERMDMPREKRACWSCFKIGHRIRDC